MPYSTADQIAEALGVDRRRVFEYVKTGMPRTAPGRFDENVCLRWMVRHQAELIKRATRQGHGDQKSESARTIPKVTLANLQITPDQSSAWQKVAAILSELWCRCGTARFGPFQVLWKCARDPRKHWGNNGRPEWTRTIDLFRVKEAL